MKKPKDLTLPYTDPNLSRFETIGFVADPVPEAPKVQSDQGSFSRGFETAMRQIPQTIGGAIGLAGHVAGSDSVKDFGMGIYDKQSAKIQEIQSDSDSFSNVLEGDGSLGDFLKYGAGYVGGQALSSIATGGIGALVGKKIVEKGVGSAISKEATRRQAVRNDLFDLPDDKRLTEGAGKLIAGKARTGAIVGGTTAMLGQNLVQSAGSIYPEALEVAKAEGRELDSGDFARIGAASVGVAAVDTAMDALGIAKVFKGSAGKSLLKRAAREVPMGMGREGFTEGIQTGIERLGAGKSLGGEGAVREYVDSIALGALGGGFAGAGAALRSQKQPEVGPLSGAANIGLETKAIEADQTAAALRQAAADPAAARVGGIDVDAIKAKLGIDESDVPLPKGPPPGAFPDEAAEPDALEDDAFKQAAFVEAIQSGGFTKKEVDDIVAANPGLKVPAGVKFADDVSDGAEKSSAKTDDAIEVNSSRLDGGQDLGMQNRDRSRPASVAQMNKIANNPDYDRLGVGKAPDEAAPLVAVKNNANSIPEEDFGARSRVTMGDGSKMGFRYAVVEADTVLASNRIDGSENPDYYAESPDGTIRALNNGRTIGITEAYRRGTAAAYRQAMIDDAAAHGVSAQAIADKKNPMLVRVYDDKANDNPNIGALSNPQSGLGLADSEAAMNDARHLSMDGFVPTDNGDVDTPDNREVLNRFAKQVQALGGDTAKVMDSAGRFAKPFVARFKAAMFAKAYKNQSLAESASDDNDPDLKNVLTALQIAAPSFAAFDDAGDLEIRPQLVQAFGKIKDARARGYNLEQYEAQQDLLGQDDFTEMLVRFMWGNQRSPRKLGEGLAALGRFIDQELTSRQTVDMFGSDPASIDAVAERVNSFLESEYGESLQQYLEENAGSYSAQPAGDRRRGGEQKEVGRAQAADADQEESVLKPYTIEELREKTEREERARKEEQKKPPPAEPDWSGTLFDGQMQLFEKQSDKFAAEVAGIINKLVTRKDATPEVKAKAKGALESIAQAIRRGSVLASVFGGGIAKGGSGSILGQRVASAADLATVSQVLRDQRFETMRYVFVKNGVVVGTTAVSSRLPSSTSTFGGKTKSERAAFLRGVQARAAEVDHVYLMHNHPSGDPTPSRADLGVTRELSKLIPNMVSHVVIDTNKFSVIEADGQFKTISQDFQAEPVVRDGVFIARGDSPQDIARIAGMFQKPGWVSLIALSPDLEVNAVMELPAEVFANPNHARVKAAISRFGRQYGAGNGVALAGFDGSVSRFEGLVRDGFLLDAVSTSGVAARMMVDPEVSASNLGRRDTSGRSAHESYSPQATGFAPIVDLLGIGSEAYTQEVLFEDTGKKATVTSKMADESKELDDRLTAARKLLECL